GGPASAGTASRHAAGSHSRANPDNPERSNAGRLAGTGCPAGSSSTSPDRTTEAIPATSSGAGPGRPPRANAAADQVSATAHPNRTRADVDGQDEARAAAAARPVAARTTRVTAGPTPIPAEPVRPHTS